MGTGFGRWYRHKNDPVTGSLLGKGWGGKKKHGRSEERLKEGRVAGAESRRLKVSPES